MIGHTELMSAAVDRGSVGARCPLSNLVLVSTLVDAVSLVRVAHVHPSRLRLYQIESSLLMNTRRGSLRCLPHIWQIHLVSSAGRSSCCVFGSSLPSRKAGQ